MLADAETGYIFPANFESDPERPAYPPFPWTSGPDFLPLLEVPHSRRPPSHDVFPQLITEHPIREQVLVVDLPQVHRADLFLQPVCALVDEGSLILGDPVGEPDLIAAGPDLEVDVVRERGWFGVVLYGVDPTKA